MAEKFPPESLIERSQALLEDVLGPDILAEIEKENEELRKYLEQTRDLVRPSDKVRG